MSPTPLKSIRNTFLYESMNKGSYLDKIIKTAMTKGKVLTPNDLSYEVNTIKRYYKYPLKQHVLEAYEGGYLKPIVLPQGMVEKIPSSVPFILTGTKEGLSAFVFIDNFKSYDAKMDLYNIDPKKFYCLLESAYMAMNIQKAFNVIARSAVTCVEASGIFAHMFIRVLNKKYALNVDRRAYSKVLYLAAKFFMVNQLGLDPTSDSVTNYALKVSDTDNTFIMNEIDKVFSTPEVFADIFTFIEAIAKNSYLITQSLAELTMKDYITDFVNMYHSSSIFALEHFSYFMFMVDSVIIGAYLNNQAILEDIVGKSGAKLYTLISNYNYY